MRQRDFPKRGEIYEVDFGRARGSEQRGVRPALVIQNNLGNQFSSTTIVAAITSRPRRAYPFHVDFTAAESGLSRDGTVLLEQIQTIDQFRLRRKRGTLPIERMPEVNRALMRSLEIPDS